jgi:hypothetical protein
MARIGSLPDSMTCCCCSLAVPAAGRITVHADSRRTEITAEHHYGLLLAGPVRGPGAVMGGDVSGGWFFGRCPAAWRGRGRLRSPGAAGRLLLPVGVRRPAPQGPAAPQVGKEPAAPGVWAFAWLPSCHRLPGVRGVPAACGTAAGTHGASVRGAGCTGLDAGLASLVRAPGPVRPEAPGRAARPRGCWLPGRGARPGGAPGNCTVPRRRARTRRSHRVRGAAAGRGYPWVGWGSARSTLLILRAAAGGSFRGPMRSFQDQ